MKQRNKKGYWAALGLGAYLLGLLLLTAAERTNPDSSIQTVGDAFWYTLVTMSTVGYGDLYPITLPGKIIGLVFILLSLGLLGYLLSLMVGAVTGRLLPAVRLWPLRGRHWYVFSSRSEPALALMEDLKKQDPQGVFLLPGEGWEDALTYPGTPESVAARKKEGCTLFFMEGPYERALKALELGHSVYCMTDYTPDSCPQGLTLFNRYDCCAQEYWRSHGLGEERELVFIGSGIYASHLLTRGLLMNVVGEQPLRYHLFGDWSEYRRDHHRLEQVYGVNRDCPGMDSLYFHEAPWNENPQLLANAGRIVICGDDLRENLAVLGKLRRFFPTGAKIHLLFDRELPGEVTFGTDAQIYTAELVLSRVQIRAAKTMHEIYLSSTGSQSPTWEELSEFLRQSNIAAADHLLTKLRLLLGDASISSITRDSCARAYEKYQALSPAEKEKCRALEHARWMVFHSLYNWQYAPKRDNAARRHPLMVLYEELSEPEQRKDDYAWEMLRELAAALDE